MSCQNRNGILSNQMEMTGFKERTIDFDAKKESNDS